MGSVSSARAHGHQRRLVLRSDLVAFGEKRTLRGHGKSVAPDPTRRLAAVK